jgi:hypothetical protein
MTVLRLRVHKHLSTPTRAGAVGTLRRVAEPSQGSAKGPVREVLIPANFTGESVAVTVDPGLWLIEATLPSGETISEEVAVEPDAGDIPVVLRAADHSPHEHLGWQHLLGNIEGRGALKERAAERARELGRRAVDAVDKVTDAAAETGRRAVDKVADTAAEAGRRAVDKVTDAAAETGMFAAAKRGTAKLLHKFDRVPGARKLRSTLGLELPRPEAVVLDAPKEPKRAEKTADAPAQPTLRMLQAAGGSDLVGAKVWETLLQAPENAATIAPQVTGSQDEAFCIYLLPDATAATTVRSFAHAEWGDERFVLAAPLPWTCIANGQPGPVEVMVRRHPSDGRMRIGVAVHDQDFGTLAGLMTASTLPKAAVVVDQAKDMLFAKVVNPLAAAAGAYVLLGVGADADKPEWHGWIDNLRHGFPHLPDGAVLAAWLRLRYPKDEQAHKQAREALFEAFARGLPYFSRGVTYLLDGLTMFAADDPEAEARAARVQGIAQRIDMSQAFTVVRASGR